MQYCLGVKPSCDANEAFKDVDVAMMVGAMPRREGMERKDLLAANVKIFKEQGQAMDQHAKKTIKVYILGYSTPTKKSISQNNECLFHCKVFNFLPCLQIRHVFLLATLAVF